MTNERRRYGVRKSLAIGLAAASLAAPSAFAAQAEFTTIDRSESGVPPHTLHAYEAAAQAHQESTTNQAVSADAMRAYHAAFQAYEDSRATQALATKVRAFEAASEQLPTIAESTPQTPVAVTTSDGISLRDASIGAAIAAIVVLAGVAMALFLRQRHPVAPGH